jgi:hypothetical protein
MAVTSKTQRRSALEYKRAIVNWVIAYVVITVLGTGLFFVLAAIQHTGSTTHPLQDPSYVLENKLLPMCNLLVWTALDLVHFDKRKDLGELANYGEALRLVSSGWPSPCQSTCWPSSWPQVRCRCRRTTSTSGSPRGSASRISPCPSARHVRFCFTIGTDTRRDPSNIGTPGKDRPKFIGQRAVDLRWIASHNRLALRDVRGRDVPSRCSLRLTAQNRHARELRSCSDRRRRVRAFRLRASRPAAWRLRATARSAGPGPLPSMPGTSRMAGTSCRSG